MFENLRMYTLVVKVMVNYSIYLDVRYLLSSQITCTICAEDLFQMDGDGTVFRKGLPYCIHFNFNIFDAKDYSTRVNYV